MTGLALGMALAPVAPAPAGARPAAAPVEVAQAGHGGQGAHAGGAEPGDRDRRLRREQRKDRLETERDVAVASTWRLDPALLVPLRTDSDATTAARRRLAVIDARLGEAMAAYDQARASADAAAGAARAARHTLARARGALLAATDRYEADRELLVDVLTESNAVGAVSAFVRVLSADTHEDLSRGLVVLEQLGRSQSDAVLAAEESRDEMRAATAAVTAAEQEARRTLDTARQTLTAATLARDQVLADLRAARRLLRDSVLADQLAAARLRAAWGVEHVEFPLPVDASFDDLDNWGQRSRHWVSTHTGDDFSAACGTPVLAATDGTVLVRTDQRWSGRWLVMVDTGPGGLSTWYAHLQSLSVTAGAQVEAGQPIGSVGAEGNAMGCHLHFEVHPDGGSIHQDDIDPAVWLRQVDAYPA